MSRKKRRGRRPRAAPMDPAQGRLVDEGRFPASLFPGNPTDAEAAGQTAVMQLAYLEDRLEEILAGNRDDGADAVLTTSAGGGSELILYMGHDLCLVRGVVRRLADRGEPKVLFRYAWLTRRAGTSVVQDAASPLEEALDEALRVAGRGEPAAMPNIVAKWVQEAQAAPAAHLAGALFRFYAIARRVLGPATFNLPDSPDSEFGTGCWIEGVLTALARQAAGLDLMPEKGPPGAVPEMLVVQTRMEDTEQM